MFIGGGIQREGVEPTTMVQILGTYLVIITASETDEFVGYNSPSPIFVFPRDVKLADYFSRKAVKSRPSNTHYFKKYPLIAEEKVPIRRIRAPHKKQGIIVSHLLLHIQLTLIIITVPHIPS